MLRWRQDALHERVNIGAEYAQRVSQVFATTVVNVDAASVHGHPHKQDTQPQMRVAVLIRNQPHHNCTSTCCVTFCSDKTNFFLPRVQNGVLSSVSFIFTR